MTSYQLFSLSFIITDQRCGLKSHHADGFNTKSLDKSFVKGSKIWA